MPAETINNQTALDTAVNHILWQQAVSQTHIEACATQPSCARCPLQHGCKL